MLGDVNNKDAVDLSAVDPATCAVLVIDELGDPSAGSLSDTLLPPTLATARIVDAAHAAGVPVIFTNDAHIKGLDRELELWGDHGIAGSPDAQVSPQIAVDSADFIVEKRRYSGFFQTGLRLLLDELGVDTLICCGMDTNICVRHTVADAYFNNYRIVVAGDATATFLVGNQDDGLEYMRVCYAAKIATTDEVVALLEGERA